MTPSRKRSARQTPAPKGKQEASQPPAGGSPKLGTLIQDWAWKRFGWVGLVVLACLGIWWQWDHIVKLPGIELLVARVTETALPKAVPGKFNIAIAHLEGDDKHETERLIRQSLAEFPSVATLSFDRLIASEQGDIENAERKGHERARALLKASGADVLIWGVVLKQGGDSLPKLYWTPARDVAQSPKAGRYQMQMTEALRLPSIFWQDLTNVLELLVANSDAEFQAQQGRYTADKLEPFIRRTRELLGSSKAEQWNAATRAQVQVILGGALIAYGEQSGKKEALREAVTTYREALKEYTRENAPLDWARTQTKLAMALTTLGERESNQARLIEAVTAYSEALKELTRENAPFSWATTQVGLGMALTVLGAQESDPARLRGAVTAYSEALKELTREGEPLGWAMTQAGLGAALFSLGERESDSARLRDAVTAFGEALKECKREKVPLFWAAVQAGLGMALATLGERESDPARLRDAVTANREALKEYKREKVPLLWAATQAILGGALTTLGAQESDPARLRDAVTAYSEALKEITRDNAPLDWAATEVGLGMALTALGERESDPAQLMEAARAYKAALLVFRAANADYYVERTERSLRNVQRIQKEINQRKNAKSAVDDDCGDPIQRAEMGGDHERNSALERSTTVAIAVAPSQRTAHDIQRTGAADSEEGGVAGFRQIDTLSASKQLIQ
jgi:tetratricopeptide (TPR) repeat protein